MLLGDAPPRRPPRGVWRDGVESIGVTMVEGPITSHREVLGLSCSGQVLFSLQEILTLQRDFLHLIAELIGHQGGHLGIDDLMIVAITPGPSLLDQPPPLTPILFERSPTVMTPRYG